MREAKKVKDIDHQKFVDTAKNLLNTKALQEKSFAELCNDLKEFEGYCTSDDPDKWDD